MSDRPSIIRDKPRTLLHPSPYPAYSRVYESLAERIHEKPGESARVSSANPERPNHPRSQARGGFSSLRAEPKTDRALNGVYRGGNEISAGKSVLRGRSRGRKSGTISIRLRFEQIKFPRGNDAARRPTNKRTGFELISLREGRAVPRFGPLKQPVRPFSEPGGSTHPDPIISARPVHLDVAESLETFLRTSLNFPLARSVRFSRADAG